MCFLKKPLVIVFTLVLSACASIDRGMMAVSDTISSPDPVTGQRQLNFTSEEQEVAQAQAVTQQLLEAAQQEGVEIDGAHYQRVSRVFNRLIEVSHRQNLPWEVHVVGLDEWNAFEK